MADAQYKVCSRCKQNLSICAFGSRKRSKDGLRAECKECRASDYLNSTIGRKRNRRRNVPTETALSLYNQGNSLAKIADMLQFSVNAVHKSLKKIGYIPRPNGPIPKLIVVQPIVPKYILTEAIAAKLKEMFERGLGTRKIAKELGLGRDFITRSFRKLGLDNSDRKRPRFASKKTEHCCKICRITKPISEFRKREKNGRISYETCCKCCEYLINKEKGNKRAKELRQTDPIFVLRKSISYCIWKMLTSNNVTKNGRSCLEFLGYTLEELKTHLERQFEPWMTWETYGPYHRKTWKDDDQNTWTWQVDHIVPQTDLPYSSMADENFQKCWALNNLRPFNSKQNQSDGVKLTRHQSKKRKTRNK